MHTSDKEITPKFLQQVAEYFVSGRYSGSLHKLQFITPNRRTGLWLKHYFKEALKKRSGAPQFLPKFQAFGKLISNVSPLACADPREQLFILYDCYRRILSSINKDQAPASFDNFIFWGEIILNDFNDIESSLASADKLYRNLAGLKEISADYLTPEQKQVIKRIWGESKMTEDIERFWYHLRQSSEDENSIGASFINLWEILGKLFSEFTDSLKKKGLATSGASERLALKELKENALINADIQYVFVGFDELSHVRCEIFNWFKNRAGAKFFWDVDSEFVRRSNDKIFRQLLKNYRMPEDFNIVYPTVKAPDIEIISVPSSVMQSKAAAHTLKTWHPDASESGDSLLRTAMVLPDETLLSQISMAIPSSVNDINISLRLPFSSTSFAALLSSIVSMQLRARQIRGSYHFFYEDVVTVLAHPHIAAIAPQTAEKITEMMERQNLFSISADLLNDKFPELNYIFTPVSDCNNVTEVKGYVTNLLDSLRKELELPDKDDYTVAAHERNLETRLLDFMIGELTEISRLIDEYKIEISNGTYLSMVEHLLHSRMIDLHGTPLKGIQILGLLETRALDFDNLIIMSMNERVLPKRNYLKTMIPDILRHGYGLPTSAQSDRAYAYYFFRLLARARNVKLLYDTRVGGLSTGEPSRFLRQLSLMFPDANIHHRTVELSSKLSYPSGAVVYKNGEVKEQLYEFKAGGSKFLSASALKDYKSCPMKFYLRYVRDLRDTDEVTDYLTPADYGTLVHGTLEDLFKPYAGKVMDSEQYSMILKDQKRIVETAQKRLKDYFFGQRESHNQNLPAEGLVMSKVISYLVTQMLNNEQKTFCIPDFIYEGGEIKIKNPPYAAWEIDSDLTVNFTMTIDRVDKIDANRLRFIDYKTGSDENSVSQIESLFKRTHTNKDGIFQLLTYCEAYSDMVNPEVEIQPYLYVFKNLSNTEYIEQIKINRKVLTSHTQVKDEFRPMLNSLVKEIFDDAIPFLRTEDTENCTYCPFAMLCGRLHLQNQV